MKKTLILTAAAIPTGVIVGAVDALFGRVLLYLGAVRDAHTAWLLPFLGVVGALMAWAYKKYGAGCENGMGMVFEAGHADREDIPRQLVPFVMCSTWLTHLFGGSAGREGVAVQLGAAISHRVGRLLRVEDAPRLMLITGHLRGLCGAVPDAVRGHGLCHGGAHRGQAGAPGAAARRRRRALRERNFGGAGTGEV